MMPHRKHQPKHAFDVSPQCPPQLSRGRVGVLLVNLGSPDAATPAAVRRYLREFLSDRRVIENQGLLWQLALNGVILPLRPAQEGTRLCGHLEQGKRRVADQDRDPLAGAKARLSCSLRSLIASHRLGDALRQALDRLAAQAISCEGLRAPSASSRSIRNMRGDDGDRLRRLFRVLASCAISRRCACPALLRGSRLYRGARLLATEPRWQNLDIHAGRHSRLIPRRAAGLYRQGDPYRAHCVEDHAAPARRLELDEASCR